MAETRYLLELAQQHAFIAGVVGWVDFDEPDAPEIIDALAEDAKLVGLRPMIQDIPDPLWMLSPELGPAFDAMIDHDLVFDALVLPRHLDPLLELAAQYPGAAHGAWITAPSRRCAAAISPNGRQASRRSPRSTHAVCKVSGLVTEAGSANPAVLAECVDHLVSVFGPQRLMWGSDWPVCELVCSYEEWYQASEMLLVTLAAPEREQIYSGTARETYGI